MLLMVDVALVALITLVLSLATWRGRVHARRGRARAVAPVADVADLIPCHATWSASVERGEAAPTRTPTERVIRGTRPPVVVSPRGRSWVVRRDGASRVSSVHPSRDAAEARGRKTARRERVVLEIRDEDAAAIDRTDYSVDRGATATEPRP